MNFLERRAEILAQHQAQEKYDPYWKAEAAAGRKISERPIAFLCDDDVCLFDECVGKIDHGLRTFLEWADDESGTSQAAKMAEPTLFAAAVQIARRYTASAVATSSMIVPQQRWNSIAYAMAQMGIEVVLTEGARLSIE